MCGSTDPRRSLVRSPVLVRIADQGQRRTSMRVLCVGIGMSLFGSLLLACATPRGEPITIHTSAPPALVAFRDDASNEWLRLDTTSATSFTLAASGPYHVI